MALVAAQGGASSTRWSTLRDETVRALSSVNLDTRTVRQLLVDSKAALLDPLARLPPLASVTRPEALEKDKAEEEQERILFEQLGLLYPDRKDGADLREYAGSLLRLAKAGDETTLVSKLSTFHGNRMGIAAMAKIGQAELGLSLLFAERYALLETVELIVSSEMLADFREELQGRGLLGHCVQRVSSLSVRIYALLSADGQRTALRPALQLGSLLRERYHLLRICFLLCCSGGRATGTEIDHLVELCRDLSTDNGVGLSLNRVSQLSLSTNMFGPLERANDWVALEKSYCIEGLIHALFACISQLSLGASPGSKTSTILQFEDSGWHQGVQGLLSIALAFSAQSTTRDQQRFILKQAFDLRSLAFLRCILRCSEFRFEDSPFHRRLLKVIAAFISLSLTWVADVNVRSPVYSEYDSYDASSALDLCLVSRQDERSKVANSDSLEDLMECVIAVCDLYRDNAFSKSFLQSNSEWHYGFLVHCSKVAEKRCFYNLISALAITDEPEESSLLCSEFLGRGFVEDTVLLLQQYRDGLIPDTRIGDCRAQLEALRTLFVTGSPRAKAEMVAQILVTKSDFVVAGFTIIAHPAVSSEELKVALLQLLAALASFPGTNLAVQISETWRRFFTLGGEAGPSNEPRCDLRAHLAQIENRSHTFSFTLGILQLARFLVVLKNDAADLAPLLQFVVGDVFFAYDQFAYAHSGGKWIVCAEALQVILDAIEHSQDRPGAGFIMMGYLLRETTLFAKLIDVLDRVGLGKGAKGLEECVVNAKRWPSVEAAQGSRQSPPKMDWFFATSRSGNLEEQQQAVVAIPTQKPLVPVLTSVGTMLRSSQTALADPSLAAMARTDSATLSVLTGWLRLSRPLPTEEHPYLWDDGDPSCANRIECARLVLRILTALIERQGPFIAWHRANASGTFPIKVQSLIASHSHVFVKVISGYVGFELDSECRARALAVLNEVAIASPNPAHQVFDYTTPSSFLFSMDQAAIPSERETMFEFLCRHRPLRILTEIAPALVRLIAASVEDSRTMSDAIRTLGLISLEEGSRLSAAGVPHDLPRRLVERYLLFVNRQTTSVTSVPPEVLSGLAWTLRLLQHTNLDASFLLRKEHEPTTLMEVLLGLFARGMDEFPDQANRFIQAWRAILQVNLNRVEDPLPLAIAVMDCITETGRSTAGTLVELAKAALSLVSVLFPVPSSTIILSSREEIFALVSRCADASLALNYARNQEALGFALTALLRVLAGLKRGREARPIGQLNAMRLLASSSASLREFDRVSLSATSEALATQSRADSLMEVCALVCMNRQAPQALRSVSATTFSELIFFSLNFDEWIEQAMRKGVFQSMIAASVDHAMEATPKDGAKIEWIETRISDSSFEPVLTVLENVARFREGAVVIADSLSTLWTSQSPILADRSSPLRFMIDQNVELARKRAQVVLPVLRLAATIAPNDIRFGLRFVRNQRPAILSCLSTFKSEHDLEEAHLFVFILAVCAKAGDAFSAELTVAEESELTAAMVGALCGCVNRVQGLDPRAYLSRTNEVKLIRACLAYLAMRSSSAASVQTLGTRKREELGATTSLIPMLVACMGLDRADLAALQMDLERCLFLTLDRMTRQWSAKDDMKELRLLFPRAVGGAMNQSSLERLSEDGKASGTFVNLLCTQLCELRFRC